MTQTEAQIEAMSRVYKPHPRYQWMSLGSIVLFLLFAWNVLAPVVRSGRWTAVNPDVGTFFFMAAALGIAIWQGRMALSRVELTSKDVSLSAPLSRVRHVAFRQLSSVSESGRGGRVITLLYHPIGANQLVDVDDLEGLALPEVVDQDSLLDHLEEHVPT
jgi:hypothetical protein